MKKATLVAVGPRRSRVRWLLGVFSLTTALAMLGIALVSVRWLAVEYRTATASAHADLSALEDAGALQGLLYQKGLAAGFFLTRDERWLEELEHARPKFEGWLTHLTREARTDEAARAVSALVAEYGRYDADRARSIERFRAGDQTGAVSLLASSIERAGTLRELADRLIDVRRSEVRDRMRTAESEWRHAILALAGTILLAIGGAGASGYFLARRIARPLDDLLRRVRSTAPHADDDDDEIGALSAHVNRLARQIAQAEKMSALGEVAAAVAHEVLNPLTGVKTALQVLARDPSGSDVAETVAAVDAEIRRVEGVARRLVSYARPLQPSLRICSLEEVLNSAVLATRHDAVLRGVHVESPRERIPMIEADPDLLVQVFVNLLVNACQASFEGGPIRLAVRREQGSVVIDVADEGAGLVPEVRDHLFTPFVTTKPDGHGLGLAVSQNIALAHAGRIEARPNLPRGTVFSVWLPEASS